ncbi:hypothetical protein PENSUB_2180 [Penicillium subrubescens]|uniref:Uncharacterized protein n=2 Tax=Penicillium subrubescens TaxID=1316194 RepID=A0A1Q5URN0_9EURO|nr:hypothetical protein PENSUB_2180 [Penicillium subrubescens]
MSPDLSKLSWYVHRSYGLAGPPSTSPNLRAMAHHRKLARSARTDVHPRAAGQLGRCKLVEHLKASSAMPPARLFFRQAEEEIKSYNNKENV